MKDGQKPLTEAEMKAERNKVLNQRHEARIQELILKQKEEQSATVKNTERIVELITKSKENLEASLEFELQDQQSHEHDKLILAFLFIAYICVYLYTKYLQMTTVAEGQIAATEPDIFSKIEEESL